MNNANKDDATEEVQSCHDEIEETISIGDIKSWNETAVQNFLTKKHLSDLLPLCNTINGMELLDLYAMCKSSSVLMYRFLKFELLKVHDKVLPISTYLRFINCLRAICDNDSELSAYVSVKHLEEYMQEDD
jgi:hypothetical protein